MQPGLCLTWSESPNAGFLVMQPWVKQIPEDMWSCKCSPDYCQGINTSVASRVKKQIILSFTCSSLLLFTLKYKPHLPYYF